MAKISLSDAVQASLMLEGTDKASMLGIGPMSKTLIKASMISAREKDYPLMFIASRNQVDASTLGGGYVCNWDQKGFAKAIKDVADEVGFAGLYYLCRDHGGPWQRDNERNAHLPEQDAMTLGKQSFLEDLVNGFDLLHVDPTKDPYVVGKTVPMEVVLARTVELIEYVEQERKARNLPPVSYEVGTEETNGGLTAADSYEEFIKLLTIKLDQKGLPRPCFIVGQTGTLTRLTENVGHFDGVTSKKLAQIAKRYKVGLKEHNGDYLDDAILLQHPALGITGMNVAPEFGTVETQSYLKLIEVENELYAQGVIKQQSKLGTVLPEQAIRSGRWKKWMVDDVVNKSPQEIMQDKKMSGLITEISGHYTFNNDEVKAEIEQLYSNLKEAGIDGENYVVTKIKDSIDRYVDCFNLTGFTSKVENMHKKDTPTNVVASADPAKEKQ